MCISIRQPSYARRPRLPAAPQPRTTTSNLGLSCVCDCVSYPCAHARPGAGPVPRGRPRGRGGRAGAPRGVARADMGQDRAAARPRGARLSTVQKEKLEVFRGPRLAAGSGQRDPTPTTPYHAPASPQPGPGAQANGLFVVQRFSTEPRARRVCRLHFCPSPSRTYLACAWHAAARRRRHAVAAHASAGGAQGSIKASA